MIQLSELSSTVRDLVAEIQEWDDGFGPMVTWGGVEVKALERDLHDHLKQFCESLDSDDFDPDCHHLVIAADNFRRHFEMWERTVIHHPELVGPDGSAELWGAWAAVVVATRPRVIRKQESVREFMRQGLSANQIAKQYGWRTPDGGPDISRAAQAMANPEEHDNLENPEDRKREDELKQAWEQRVDARQAKAEDLARINAPAPESLAELVTLPNITVANIEKTTKGRFSREDIESEAKRLGVDLPDAGANYDRPLSAVERLQQMEEEDKQRAQDAAKMEQGAKTAGDEDQDITLRAQALAKDGYTAEQIVELFRRQDIETTIPEVSKMLKPKRGRGRPKKEPAEA